MNFIYFFFIGGCGKFIEGDAKDMYNVLYNILGQLPRDTKVYCGHECALNNLQVNSILHPRCHITMSYINENVTNFNYNFDNIDYNSLQIQ